MIYQDKKDLDKVLERKKFKSPGKPILEPFRLIGFRTIKAQQKLKQHPRKILDIADETGKEVSRDIDIDESQYTELVPEFEDTYFKKFMKQKEVKLGRVRLLLKEPRSISWHKDQSLGCIYQL